MLPMTFNSGMNMPQVSDPKLATAMFETAFSGFSAGVHILKARRADFYITGLEQSIPNGQVAGVLLGIMPYNFCTYYAKEYVPGQEPARPDLQWIQKDPNDFPDALPVKFRQKIDNGNGTSRWAFRTARRTVWALCTPDPEGRMILDLENPVVFDLTSSSMYGKGDPQSYSYKWSGLRMFCLQHSAGGIACNPSMFVTQINLDMKSTVSGVVVFRPCGPNGQPIWLDSDSYEAVCRASRSPLVQNLLQIQEILGVASAPKPSTPPASPAPERAAPARPAPSSSLLAQADAIIEARAQETASAPVQSAAVQSAPASAPAGTAPAGGDDVKRDIMDMLSSLGA